MVLAKFRQQYPQGSLVSELIDIDRGTYIVKVSVSVERVVLATGLAGADRVETAEDLARERAIAALMLDQALVTPSASLSNSINRKPVATVSQVPPTTESSINSFPKGSSTTERSDSIASEQPVQPMQVAIPQTTIPAENATTTPTTPLTSVAKPSQPPVATTSTVATEQTTTSNLFEGTYNPEINLESNGQEVNTATSVASQPEANSSEAVNMTDFDFMQIKQKTDLEIQRLGWTKEYGREFLKSHYGKRTRLHLTNEELLQFLQYLESQPTPS